MARMIDIEALKPLIQPLIPEGDVAVIEGIMGASVDYDEEAEKQRTETAVNEAKEAARKEYADKVREMFFGKATHNEGAQDDTAAGAPEGTPEVPDIFTEG